MRIHPSEWLKDRYAKSRGQVDLVRFPVEGYADLPAGEKDRLRQTQLEGVVRLPT